MYAHRSILRGESSLMGEADRILFTHTVRLELKYLVFSLDIGVSPPYTRNICILLDV